MIITEVRIKLMEDAADRLRAFCSITFDQCFVVRDLKIIEGNNGPFVAMPSRKIMIQCQKCGTKNHLRAHFCNQCGARVQAGPFPTDAKSKLYADIAHPINAECREMIQSRVLKEFEQETERSKKPGYVSRYDEEYGNIDPTSSPTDARPARRLDSAEPTRGPTLGAAEPLRDRQAAEQSPAGDAPRPKPE